MSNYSSDNIQHLEGLAHIRKRPWMYVWDNGMVHLFKEVIGNSFDEVLGGYANEVIVILKKNNIISVKDNGRWVPVGVNKQTGKNSLELVTWTVNTSWKYSKGWEGSWYLYSSWLNWIWIKAVNALSNFFEVHSYSKSTWEKEKKDWVIRYENLEVHTPVKSLGKTTESWTLVIYQPSEEVFWNEKYKAEELKNICRQQAYLSKGAKVIFIDEENNTEETFQYNGWAKEYLQSFFEEDELIVNEWVEVNIWKDEKETYGWFESVIFFTKKGSKKAKDIRESFANNVYTGNGWTHLNAYERWILNAFKRFAKERKFNEKQVEQIVASDILINVFYVINVKIVETQFVGQTKDKLANKEITNPLRSAIEELFYIELLKNPEEYDKIIKRALENVANRSKVTDYNFDEILEEIKNEAKIGKYLGRLKMSPNKKAPAEERMIYIVEWLSAGGSILKTRDNLPIDLLSLKGKILNIEERYDTVTQKLSKAILNNEEIRSIISAFGGNVWDNFDEKTFPYKGWVVIMADSDPDGWHISLLLINLFHKLYWKDFVNKYLYISELPLFQINYAGKRHFFQTTKEKDVFLEGKNITEKDIFRFKGLGEVPSSLFKELAIDPKTRKMKKLIIEDSDETNKIYQTLLGNDASLRREFFINQELDLDRLEM